MTKFGSSEATSSGARQKQLANPQLGVSFDVDVNYNNNNDGPSSETNNVITIRSIDNKNIFSNPKDTDQIISCIKLDKINVDM